MSDAETMKLVLHDILLVMKEGGTGRLAMFKLDGAIRIRRGEAGFAPESARTIMHILFPVLDEADPDLPGQIRAELDAPASCHEIFAARARLTARLEAEGCDPRHLLFNLVHGRGETPFRR